MFLVWLDLQLANFALANYVGKSKVQIEDHLKIFLYVEGNGLKSTIFYQIRPIKAAKI